MWRDGDDRWAIVVLNRLAVESQCALGTNQTAGVFEATRGHLPDLAWPAWQGAEGAECRVQSPDLKTFPPKGQEVPRTVPRRPSRPSNRSSFWGPRHQDLPRQSGSPQHMGTKSLTCGRDYYTLTPIDNRPIRLWITTHRPSPYDGDG